MTDLVLGRVQGVRFLEAFHSYELLFVRLTACVTRWWVGRDHATLTEPTSSHENGLKTRRSGEGAIKCDRRPPQRSCAGDPTTAPLLLRGSGARRERREAAVPEGVLPEWGCVRPPLSKSLLPCGI